MTDMYPPFDARANRPSSSPESARFDGQDSGEFGEFPVESVVTALRGAGNALVEKLLQDRNFDAYRYVEDLVEIFGHVVRSPR